MIADDQYCYSPIKMLGRPRLLTESELTRLMRGSSDQFLRWSDSANLNQIWLRGNACIYTEFGDDALMVVDHTADRCAFEWSCWHGKGLQVSTRTFATIGEACRAAERMIAEGRGK